MTWHQSDALLNSSYVTIRYQRVSKGCTPPLLAHENKSIKRPIYIYISIYIHTAVLLHLCEMNQPHRYIAPTCTSARQTTAPKGPTGPGEGRRRQGGRDTCRYHGVCMYVEQPRSKLLPSRGHPQHHEHEYAIHGVRLLSLARFGAPAISARL